MGSWWLAGGAMAGLLAAGWSHLRSALSRLTSLMIVRARIEGDLGRAVIAYCWQNFRRSPFGDRRYDSSTAYVQPVERYQLVGFENIGTESLVFWKGLRPLLLGMKIASRDRPQPSDTAFELGFLRGTFDLDRLLIEALAEMNRHRHEGNQGARFKVERLFGQGSRLRMASYSNDGAPQVADPPGEVGVSGRDRRYLQWKPEEIGMGAASDPFGALAFPPSVLDAIEQARRWLRSEKWYKEKRIPWRMGLLFYGVPGTGKTSAVVAMGRELGLPVFAFDLASFSNQDFTTRWDRLLNETPCMALLEDIDAVFQGRENRLGEEGGGLTFDCLLNCISGARDSSGVLTIVTTNHVESLDEALGKPDGTRGVSTRPGRIDRAVELPRLDADCRRKIAERVLADCAWEIDRLVEEGDGDSGAQFTERCSRVALAHYWKPY